MMNDRLLFDEVAMPQMRRLRRGKPRSARATQNLAQITHLIFSLPYPRQAHSIA